MTNIIQQRLTHLDAKPENVVWGYFDADIAPVLHIQSGETVQINTVSLSGIKPGEHPVDFFGRNGIPAEDVLEDMAAVQFNKSPIPGLGAPM
jgi:acetamidase/formamidase